MLRSICAAMLLLGTLSANAVTTFAFQLSGSVDHLRDAWECPDQNCDPQTETFPWLGTVSVETNSDADGLYTGANLRLHIATNFYDAVIDAGDETIGDFWRVTLLNGEVASFDTKVGVNGPGELTVRLSGLGADFSVLHTTHQGPYHGVASLTSVPAIPEPAVFALLAGGLGLLLIRPRHSLVNRGPLIDRFLVEPAFTVSVIL